MRIWLTTVLLSFGFAAAASAQSADTGALQVHPAAKSSPAGGNDATFAQPVRLGAGRLIASISIPWGQTNDGSRLRLTMGGPRRRSAVVYAVMAPSPAFTQAGTSASN